MNIAVIGSSGCGKTFIAKRLAERYGLEHIEMDSMAFDPGWTLRPVENFKADLEKRLEKATSGWVTDGNWESIGGIQLLLADKIIWLDLPRSAVMRQLIPRTLFRVLTRKKLWNGLREPFSNLYSFNPEKSVVLWSWQHFPSTRAHYERCLLDESWSHAEVLRLRSRTEINAFLDC
jgi:adenylate kinase family enzyme